MISGIISSNKRCLGYYSLYAYEKSQENRVVMHELEPGNTINIEAIKSTPISENQDSTVNYYFMYANSNLSYDEDLKTFSPDDVTVGNLQMSCDLLVWQTDATGPLVVVKDSSNLGLNLMAKQANFITTKGF